MIGALVLAAITPLCTSNDISSTIAATDTSAGHAQMTIALRNVSKRACQLEPFPALSFQHYSELAPVTMTRQSGNAPAVVLQPGGAAALTFTWFDMAAKRPCVQMADALLRLRGGGLPLWIPVDVNACLPMVQSPLTSPAPQTTITPAGDDFVASNDRWLGTQDCQSRLLRLTMLRQRAKPRSPDELNVDVSHGTYLNFSGHTGQAVAAPTDLFDPARAIFVSGGIDAGIADTTACNRIHSIPYGIARWDTGVIRTRRGITFGMSPGNVKRIDGPAPTITLDGAFSAIHYEWKRGAELFDLSLLFYNPRLMAMDYVDNPQQ